MLVGNVEDQISKLKNKNLTKKRQRNEDIWARNKRKNFINKRSHTLIQRENRFMQSQLKQQKAVKMLENLTVLSV